MLERNSSFQLLLPQIKDDIHHGHTIGKENRYNKMKSKSNKDQKSHHRRENLHSMHRLRVMEVLDWNGFLCVCTSDYIDMAVHSSPVLWNRNTYVRSLSFRSFFLLTTLFVVNIVYKWSSFLVLSKSTLTHCLARKMSFLQPFDTQEQCERLAQPFILLLIWIKCKPLQFIGLVTDFK